jgi:adenine-specific DNA methylase
LHTKKEILEYNLDYRSRIDFEGIQKAESFLKQQYSDLNIANLIPTEPTSTGLHDSPRNYEYGLRKYEDCFNPRQLLALVTYLEIINQAKTLIHADYDWEQAEAIITYLSLILSNCVDKNCRLVHLNASKCAVESALAQHSLNLFWNYPETNFIAKLWQYQSKSLSSDYSGICNLLSNNYFNASIPQLEQRAPKLIQINSNSADNLAHISDNCIDVVVTDPPYYSVLQYAEMSDFFYVWLKRILGDILPELFYLELTDKDREAVANPSRFRNMGVSPEELANQDYEAKMAMAFAEYHRVLRDDGVMTVQFNHKDSGAWDVLAKSLIDAGFEITASWAVSTENPQNLHQAQKNAVSSTVLLVCRKRDPNAGQAWWDDVRIDVRNIVFEKAPDIEKSLTADTRPAADRVADPRRRVKPPGIDLCLTAYGCALSVFTRYSSILDSAGNQVEPKAAFEEVRQAIVEYRLQNLLEGKDFNGIDPLTQWYILAWDTFEAREFPFDEAGCGQKSLVRVNGDRYKANLPQLDYHYH